MFVKKIVALKKENILGLKEALLFDFVQSNE